MSYNGVAPIRFGSVSMVTGSLGPNDPEVGTVVDDGNDRLIFVYNGGNSQISVGQGAVLSGVSGYTVTVSSITHSDVAIGVCKHATLTTSTYGWLLQRGFSTAQAGSAVAIASPITLGADGTWQAQLTTTAYSQVATPPVFGKAMTSAASSASFQAYFRI